MDEQQYTTLRKRYGLLCSAPIFIAIIHSIGQILLQTFLKFNAATGYSSCPGKGIMYSSSLLLSLVLSGKENVDLVNSISSVITIVFTLALILFSSFAVKGKKGYVLAMLVSYSIDTVCLLPLLLVNYIASPLLQLTTVDVILSVLLHAVSFAICLYLYLISRKLDRYEQENQ